MTTPSQSSYILCLVINSFYSFFSLPPEVRTQIYRLLLVQPCKFNMYHSNPCKKPYMYYDASSPDWTSTEFLHTCVRCGAVTPTVNDAPPKPSKWAQPPLNPFLCIYCHWDRVGREGDNMSPPIKKQRCLCSRRENLEILCTNRQIHDEAAYVFWTENWFGFEHHGFLIGLLSVVRPHIRSWIRRITFLPEPEYLDGWMSLNDTWKYLRLCTGLQVLELDGSLLSSRHFVLAIRTVHVNGKMSFVREVPYSQWVHAQRGYPNNYIWPAQALRRKSRMPLADILADSLTGEPFETEQLECIFDECWEEVAKAARVVPRRR